MDVLSELRAVLLLAAALLSCEPGAQAMCGSTIMRQDFSAHPGAYQHQTVRGCESLFPVGQRRLSGDGRARQAGYIAAASGTCERLQLGQGKAKLVHKKGIHKSVNCTKFLGGKFAA